MAKVGDELPELAKGGLRAYWAISVNGPWRIIFKFKGGHSYDVEITDYH